MDDPRRRVPRTDALLGDARLAGAITRLGRDAVKSEITRQQHRVRNGGLAPEACADAVVAALPRSASSLRPVLNATGVVLHTNLGRAPLSAAARTAMADAAGYTDVEFDLVDGVRAPRGRGALRAMRSAVPSAGDVLAVNNGAAALVLATTALAAGREVIVSRGEMVEIGDGFRLPDLIASTGAHIREVGTTNRTHLADYASAVSDRTGCILKVHPSNFRVEGFTSSVSVEDLASLGPHIVVDVGSGLLGPDPLLPDEPDVSSALAAGATIVTCSGDKLWGGPQAGLVFGDAEAVGHLRTHPLARALRVDKTTLAALEATFRGPVAPSWQAIRVDPETLRRRAEAVAGRLEGAEVVPSEGAVGGGCAPGVGLPGWAVALPPTLALLLRQGEPPVVARIERDRCLVDLRCIPDEDDDRLLAAILSAVQRMPG